MFLSYYQGYIYKPSLFSWSQFPKVCLFQQYFKRTKFAFLIYQQIILIITLFFITLMFALLFYFFHILWVYLVLFLVFELKIQSIYFSCFLISTCNPTNFPLMLLWLHPLSFDMHSFHFKTKFLIWFIISILTCHLI